jgi:hypothetical protein
MAFVLSGSLILLQNIGIGLTNVMYTIELRRRRRRRSRLPTLPPHPK